LIKEVGFYCECIQLNISAYSKLISQRTSKKFTLHSTKIYIILPYIAYSKQRKQLPRTITKVSKEGRKEGRDYKQEHYPNEIL
jgi:hypothetical protein